MIVYTALAVTQTFSNMFHSFQIKNLSLDTIYFAIFAAGYTVLLITGPN